MPQDVTTLIEALPYIREFRGKTFVIRCAPYLAAADRKALCHDIATLRYVGVKTVVVHPHEEAGDERTATGHGRQQANHQLVHAIGAYGNATGLSGSDGAPRWLLSLDADGNLIANEDLVLHVLDDYTPVIEAVAVDAAGQARTADPDLAAAKLAIALDAYKLLLVPSSGRVTLEQDGGVHEISEMCADPDIVAAITSGPDVRSAVEAGLHAIAGGVRFAHILRSDEPHAALLELFTDGGFGTKIRSEAEWDGLPRADFPASGYTLWGPRENSPSGVS